MKKNLLIGFLIFCILAAMFVGCTPSSPAAGESEADSSAETETPETDIPETETQEEIDDPEPTEEATVFVMNDDQSCNHFTNGIVDILFRQDSGSVVRVDLSTGEEETLFTIAPDDSVNIAMIGVTDHRLYFGWNEVEDWWGVDVYSVDYHGEDRQDFGSAWEPSFEGGWLVLLGFRTDVSSTELLLINRYDEIVAEDQTGAVWDAAVLDDAVYYVIIEDLGENPWSRDDLNDMDGKWKYDLVRADHDGGTAVVKVFENRSTYYSPASIQGGVLCFYESSEFYDVRTLEPTTDPNGLTGI